MPGISIWSGLWKWLLAIKVLVWKRRFCGLDRGWPRTAPRKQLNRENSMGILLTDKKVLQKNRFRRFPGAETGVFTCFFLSMFSKPNLLHAFQEKVAAQAAIHWATARPNRARTTAKTQGFGNMLIKVIVKTHGSASEQCPNPVFSHVFIPLNWLSHNPKKKTHEFTEF